MVLRLTADGTTTTTAFLFLAQHQFKPGTLQDFLQLLIPWITPLADEFPVHKNEWQTLWAFIFEEFCHCDVGDKRLRVGAKTVNELAQDKRAWSANDFAKRDITNMD